MWKYLQKVITKRSKKVDFHLLLEQCFRKYFEREPDEAGMRFYLEQLQSGALRPSDIPRIFTDSEEYIFLQLVKKRNEHLPLEQRMQQDWDDRARENARFFVRTVYDQTDEDFWKSGEEDCRSILGNDSGRFARITAGRDPGTLSVLDVGCGIGRILKPMSHIFGKAVGVDVSPQMVTMARTACQDTPCCEFHVNNGSDLKMFDDDTFDFCYSYIAFQHIPSKKIILHYIKEVCRILKPVSLFRFQVHGQSDRNPIDGSTWNGVHFTREEMIEVARLNHCQITEEDGHNDQFFWLTFKMAD